MSPPTAADRSGNRSPAIATIIGNTGPDAKPTTPNRTIDAATDGTTTAANVATPAIVIATVVNRRWSNRSEIRAETSRPSANPAQNSDKAPVAVPSGTLSRNRTSQFDTPTSAAT